MNTLIIVFLTAIITLFSGVFGNGKYTRAISILGLLVALGISFLPESAFFEQYRNMYEYTPNVAIFTKIALVVTILLFGLGEFAFSNHRSHQSELYALMLFALCGGIILFGYKNFTVLFLGIEILSIPLYVMAGANKTNLYSIEASVKYFLMGAFATGFLLFGMALVYGSVGSFDVSVIGEYAKTKTMEPMFIMGVVLMLVALAFKVSLAPFHMWSPDVYQGSPSLITAFMASVVKVSGFGAFFRLMTEAFGGVMSSWISVVAVLVIITLLLANIMGLVQSNAKRMLAYSSVSHAGYISIVFFGANEQSINVLGFYLFAYSLATIGVFMSLIYVEKIKNETSYHAFKGLAKTEPLLAVVTAISLFSMAGIPFTAGFIGKLSLFAQAINVAPFLIVIAVIGSAVSIAYYLRIIIAMFFTKESTFEGKEKAGATYNILAVLIIVLLIVLGVYPQIFSEILVK